MIDKDTQKRMVRKIVLRLSKEYSCGENMFGVESCALYFNVSEEFVQRIKNNLEKPNDIGCIKTKRLQAHIAAFKARLSEAKKKGEEWRKNIDPSQLCFNLY